MSAVFALRKAVRTAMMNDATLTGLLGGMAVYDEVPRAIQAPYVVLETSDSKDISGTNAPLAEHRLTLVVWSREAGLAQAVRIAERMASVLDDAALALDGYRLVNLRWLNTQGRRANERYRTTTLAFRAVTEPL